MDGAGRKAARGDRQRRGFLAGPGGRSVSGSGTFSGQPLVRALPDRAADRLMLIDVLLASQTLRARLAAEAGLLSNLFGDGWHEKKTVFRLIHDVARTVGDLTSFDPRLNIERVLGIARDGSAAAHGDHLEADLDEVAKLLAEVMKFLDLDAAAIFQTNSAAAINLNKVSERAAKWAANPGRFEEWARLAAADREARASGPARIASTLASGRLEPKNAILEIETAFAEACWKKAIAGDPELSRR